jgi:predicted nucleotidyltransferase
MDKDTVKAILRPHATELKNSGIQSLSLFGSVARGDATGQSDIDLMSDFDRARRLTLFDLAGLELRLAEILQAPVDLCDRRMMKDEVRLQAEREAVIVF